MFSSKSVIKGKEREGAKSFLSEDGILFSEDTAAAGKKSAEHLSDASTAPVAYQNFLGDIFHQTPEPAKEQRKETTEEFFSAEESELLSEPETEETQTETEAAEDDFTVSLPVAARSRLSGENHDDYTTLLVQQSIERAEKLLDMSRREAEKIREDARIAGYEEGLRQGREDGRRAGREEVRAEFQKQVDSFYKDCTLTLGTIEDLKKQRLSRYLDELKEVSIAVAEKVIHISLSSSGEVIRKMILQEAEKLKRTSWLKIYIDKAEYEMLLETDSQIASELVGVARNIRFVISEKGEMGKLIMETPDEIIDLSIGTQMENLRTKLSQLEPRVDK